MQCAPHRFQLETNSARVYYIRHDIHGSMCLWARVSMPGATARIFTFICFVKCDGGIFLSRFSVRLRVSCGQLIDRINSDVCVCVCGREGEGVRIRTSHTSTEYTKHITYTECNNKMPAPSTAKTLKMYTITKSVTVVEIHSSACTEPLSM